MLLCIVRVYLFAYNIILIIIIHYVVCRTYYVYYIYVLIQGITNSKALVQPVRLIKGPGQLIPKVLNLGIGREVDSRQRPINGMTTDNYVTVQNLFTGPHIIIVHF